MHTHMTHAIMICMPWMESSLYEEWDAGAVMEVEQEAWIGVLKMDRHHRFREKAHGCI